MTARASSTAPQRRRRRDCRSGGSKVTSAGMPTRRQRVLDDDEVRDRQPAEDERRARRPAVAAADGEPGERHGLGRPRHRDGRRAELDERRDRERGRHPSRPRGCRTGARDPGGQEPAADERGGRARQARRTVPRQASRSPSSTTKTPHSRNARVREHERRARRPEVVAPDAHLLAGRGDDVDEPEARERDQRLGGSGSPASQLASCGRRQHEGERRQPAPRAEERRPPSCRPASRRRTASVRSVGDAPTSGGATSAATSPKAATLRASKRTAMTAAATAATSAPASPTSGGTRPYRRVAANSAIEIDAQADAGEDVAHQRVARGPAGPPRRRTRRTRGEPDQRPASAR